MREVVYARGKLIVIKKGTGFIAINKSKPFKNGHTHIRNLHMAVILVKNIVGLRVPKTRDKYLIISHIRLANNKEYIDKLNSLLEEL